MSVRILKVSSAVLEVDYSTFALKKGSTPDPSQLLRGQDPAQYPIIILMETIKDLYAGASLSLDQLRAFVEVVETRAKAFLASVIRGLSQWDQNPRLGPAISGARPATALSLYCNGCCDPRGRHGSIRQELTARVSDFRNHSANSRGREVGRP
jgi:hypothetical protein